MVPSQDAHGNDARYLSDGRAGRKAVRHRDRSVCFESTVFGALSPSFIDTEGIFELPRTSVESRLGAGADAERRPVSQPRSSNRTCGFPASGFPTGFIVNSRTRAHWPLQADHAQRAKHHFLGELASAVRRHLVTPSQKLPHLVIGVLINRPVRLAPSPAVEIKQKGGRVEKVRE